MFRRRQEKVQLGLLVPLSGVRGIADLEKRGSGLGSSAAETGWSWPIASLPLEGSMTSRGGGTACSWMRRGPLRRGGGAKRVGKRRPPCQGLGLTRCLQTTAGTAQGKWAPEAGELRLGMCGSDDRLTTSLAGRRCGSRRVPTQSRPRQRQVERGETEALTSGRGRTLTPCVRRRNRRQVGALTCFLVVAEPGT